MLYQTKCDTCQIQECEGCKENVSSVLNMDEVDQLLNEEIDTEDYECPFCNLIVDSELKCGCTWND